MRKYLFLLLVFFGLGCLPMLIRAGRGTTAPSAQNATNTRQHNRITVRAASRNNPAASLGNGIELSAAYTGSSQVQQLFNQGLAQPCALDSADFDEDGVPDLIAGYRQANGGSLAFHRGNLDSIYPNNPEAQRRKASGEFTDAAFLSPARLFELAEAADFLAAGDFDGDGHMDVVTAARGSKSLYLLSGDGHGNLAAARQITLPGTVTALISGEINRADGLADLIASVVTAGGPQVMVFEGPDGALKAKPEVFSLPAAAKALALARLDDDYLMDLAVAAGRELMIVHGRDRRLSLDEKGQAEVLPATVEHHTFAFAINSIAVGDFNGSHQSSLALLSADGTVYLSSAKAAPVKPADVQSLGQWPGVSQLRTARVSVGPADDLLMLDQASRQVHLLTGAKSRATTAAALSTTILNTESEPLAVLPMRLNGDALSDLVILQSGSTEPTVVKTVQVMTFTINKADDHDDGVCDSGDCTLREAINAANANIGADTLAFNIAGAGVHTIMPTSALPVITDPVTIDGSTQPGFAGTPIIELSGLGGGLQQFNGLTISAGSSTIRNLVINHFRGVSFGNGIVLTTNGNNIIEGNYIGTDPSGLAIAPNETDGVLSNGSSNNRIGGTTVAARNLISANSRIGVEILASDGNLVQGNYLGTDVTGNRDLGNAFAGVFIVAGQPTNIVGGAMAGAGNLISGNDSAGVKFIGGGSIAQGNYIGTNATGTARLANYRGVDLGDDSNSLIGGTTIAARNIISGNDQEGIAIAGGDAMSNRVEGNFIGTDFSGTLALGNSHFGIIINSGSENVIGGAISGAGNLIAFNAFGGIAISGGLGLPFNNSILGNTIFSNTGGGVNVFDGRSITIRGNSIFSNAGLGIDIAPFGVNPNDDCDTDSGLNDLQNYPVLNSVTSTGISVTIQGTLNSTLNSTFTLEVFASDTCDPSGYGEGQTFIGSTMVTTGSDCNATFNVTLPVAVHAGQVITATATDPAGNTSEFSQCAPIITMNPFDLCLQDESNGNILLLNLTTGNYQFSNCRGITLTGTGTITRKGCLVSLQVNGPDRRILANIDTCMKKGTASVQSFTQNTTFTILDKNTANNSCICAASSLSELHFWYSINS